MGTCSSCTFHSCLPYCVMFIRVSVSTGPHDDGVVVVQVEYLPGIRRDCQMTLSAVDGREAHFIRLHRSLVALNLRDVYSSTARKTSDPTERQQI